MLTTVLTLASPDGRIATATQVQEGWRDLVPVRLEGDVAAFPGLEGLTDPPGRVMQPDTARAWVDDVARQAGAAYTHSQTGSAPPVSV